MKNFILYTALLAVIISFTGCGGTGPKPSENKTKALLKTIYTADQSEIAYNGWLKVERDNEIGTIAVVLKDVAKHYKALGYTHFSFFAKNRVPFIITNMSDLVSYCYPEASGFSKKGLHSRNTSLEYGKCSLKYNFKEKNNGVTIRFKGYKGISSIPRWSVEDVLADKNIDFYIKAMLDDMKIEGNHKFSYILSDHSK